MKFENPKYNSNRSFIDFMFILVCCLTLFFTLTLLRIIKEQDSIVNKAEFLITLMWEKNSVNDIDLWIKDPNGAIVYYKDRDSVVAFLDRDDLGKINDTIIVDGVEKEILINQEVISIRGIIPGKWIVQVHYYKKHDTREQSATAEKINIRMDKLNPKATIIFDRDMVLEKVWDEKTVATFEILPDGSTTNISYEEEIPLIEERIIRPTEMSFGSGRGRGPIGLPTTGGPTGLPTTRGPT